MHCSEIQPNICSAGLGNAHDDDVELLTVQFTPLTLEVGTDCLHPVKTLLLPCLVVQIDHPLTDIDSKDGLRIGYDLLRH